MVKNILMRLFMLSSLLKFFLQKTVDVTNNEVVPDTE